MTIHNSFPFYFAWVDADTAFNSSVHNVEDEPIASISISCKEGEFAFMKLRLKNPHQGPLLAGRKQWAWLSWQDVDGAVGSPGVIYPLFYGRQVSVPKNLIGELFDYDFIAQPTDTLAQQQAIARTLMSLPAWEPVFTAPERRLDPQAVMEARAATWATDRITHDMSVSHLLIAEDGVIEWTETDVIRDSVSVTIDQPPLRSVYVDSTVAWEQRATGTIDMGDKGIQCTNGDALLSAWPKGGTDIGAGWSVRYGAAVDQWRSALAHTGSIHSSYRNREEKHAYGDTMSVEIDWTYAVGAGGSAIPFTEYKTSEYSKIAVIDPDPGGFNDPVAEAGYTGVVIVPWSISASLVVRYEARRQRTENLRFTLFADLQPAFSDPGGVAANFAQDSELISLQGNVGLEGPYGTFQGAFTGGASYVLYDFFTDDSSGETLAYQVTRDHKAQSSFDVQETASVWQANTLYSQGDTVSVGSLVYAVMVSHRSQAGFSPTQLTPDGKPVYSLQLNPLSGQRLYTPLSGFRGYYTSGETYVTGDIVIDSDTGLYYRTVIGNTASSSTLDPYGFDTTGRLLWAPLLNPPPIQDIGRGQYFSTARGRQTIRHLILRARKKIIQRARCVRVEFTSIDWAKTLAITMRKGGKINDARLPAGNVVGKIIDYEISIVPPDGFRAKVTLGCAIGNGTAISAGAGTPTYCDASYCGNDYQEYDSVLELIGAGDVAYQPPAYAAIDDGLEFPLTKDQAVVSEDVQTGDVSYQLAMIQAQSRFDQLYNNPKALPQGRAEGLGGSIEAAKAPLTPIRDQITEQVQKYAQAIASTPIWYRLVLKPVQNGPWAKQYDINVSVLSLPKQIDLAAASFT